jgi:hypothetical protein
MQIVQVPKRLVFYCGTCQTNPHEQPADHIKRTGHSESKILLVWVPDVMNVPKGAVKA